MRVGLLCFALGLLPVCGGLHANSFPKSFRTLNTSNGLINSTINDIDKDSRGFVWIATDKGVNRFDGIDMVALPVNDRVNAVCECDSTYVWIGTDNGLFRWNRVSERVESLEYDGCRQIKALHSYGEGNMLVGTQKGLSVYENGSFERILFDPDENSLHNDVVHIADSERSDVFWLCTADGLVRFDSSVGKWETHRAPFDMANINNFSTAVYDGDETLWVGTANQGVMKFDIVSSRFTLMPEIDNPNIKTLDLVGRDSLYVGTNGGGVKLVSASTGKTLASLEHTDYEKNICSNAVYSVLIDGEVMWVGTYMAGLSYNPTHSDIFSTYSFEPLFDSRNKNICSFWIGENGVRLVGSRDGLYYISEFENSVRRFSTKNSVLRSNIIAFVYPCGRNRYLVGTFAGGLYVMDAESMELELFSEKENFFKDASFLKAVADDSGAIWIASSVGIFRYSPLDAKYERYVRSNSNLASDYCMTVFLDSRHRLWAGTLAGVSVCSPNSGSVAFDNNFLPDSLMQYSTRVNNIAQDSRGDIYLFDQQNGVIKVDATGGICSRMSGGMFSDKNVVNGLIDDRAGNLWFSSQHGLFSIEQGRYRRYSLYDGITGDIFNGACQITSDGSIWWGNEEGLIRYLPDWNTMSQTRPEITSISVSGELLSAADGTIPVSAESLDELVLSWWKKNVEFTVSGLNYPIETVSMFEYFLEGYDIQWNTLERGNRITYLKLPTGKYVFHLRLARNSGAERLLAVTVKHNPMIVYALWVLLAMTGALIIQRARFVILRRRAEAAALADRYSKAKIEPKDMEVIKRRMNECMKGERLYLNPHVKLQDIASATGVSAAKLSQVLNMHLHTNFPDWVNGYRCEEFIERLKHEESVAQYTLTSLSEMCGFSSRTSFFRSFKKYTGKTPAEYLRGE